MGDDDFKPRADGSFYSPQLGCWIPPPRRVGQPTTGEGSPLPGWFLGLLIAAFVFIFLCVSIGPPVHAINRGLEQATK